MIYGYIRVSKKDQSLQRQLDSIKSYCPDILESNIFCDKKSGKTFSREEYLKLKSKVRAGDEIIIHELDRFGRNKEEIKAELKELQAKGIRFRILNIPTTLSSVSDDWMFDMVNNILIEVYSSLAEKERELISSRTREGQRSARRRGKKPGRPVLNPEICDLALRLWSSNAFSTSEICEVSKISKSSLYTMLSQEKPIRNSKTRSLTEKEKITLSKTLSSSSLRAFTEHQLFIAIRLWRANICTLSEITNYLNCSAPTFYRYLWLIEAKEIKETP